MTRQLVLTGATGFLGSHLIPQLRLRECDIHILSRNPLKAREIYPDAKHHLWAPGVSGDWRDAVADADAVIHLAGESIGGQRWTEQYKKRIRESRIIGTRDIVDAIPKDKTNPPVLISSSAIGYYGDRGDEEVTEATPAGRDFLAQICVDWEREARNAERKGARVVLPRNGLVMAMDGGALPRMMTPFRFFVGGPIGSGKQWFPWIYVDDVVRFFLRALEDESMSGPYNLVAPEPIRNREFSSALGQAMDKPSFFPVPGFVLRIVVGAFAKTLLGGQKAIPERLLNAGFEFKHPKLEETLRSMV